MRRIADIAKSLEAGARSRGLVEECLARIKDPAGEGKRVYLKLHEEASVAAADFYDRLRARGSAPSPFAGIPVSIKDLFDIAGDVTTAGSTILRDAAPAKHDAPGVASSAYAARGVRVSAESVRLLAMRAGVEITRLCFNSAGCVPA